MVHIRSKCKAIIPVLQKKGFKGIKFEQLYLEGSDDPENGETAAEKADWDTNYSIMIVNPIFGGAFRDLDAYTSIDEEGFYRDFFEYLRENFGQEIEIIHHEQTHEIELVRTSQ